VLVGVLFYWHANLRTLRRALTQWDQNDV